MWCRVNQLDKACHVCCSLHWVQQATRELGVHSVLQVFNMLWQVCSERSFALGAEARGNGAMGEWEGGSDQAPAPRRDERLRETSLPLRCCMASGPVLSPLQCRAPTEC